MDNRFEKLGERIRVIRKSKKLTIEKLGELIDKSLSYIGNIERAEGTPSLATVISIANALGVSADTLLRDYLLVHCDESELDIYSPLLSKLRTLSQDEQKALHEFLCKIHLNKSS